MIIKRKKRFALSLLATLLFMYFFFPLYQSPNLNCILDAYSSNKNRVYIALNMQNHIQDELDAFKFSIQKKQKETIEVLPKTQYIIYSRVHQRYEHFILNLRPKLSGDLMLTVAAPNCKNNKCSDFPPFVYYANLTINGKKLFSAPQDFSSDTPFSYTLKVKKGDNIEIQYDTRRHMWKYFEKSIDFCFFTTFLLLSFLLARGLVYWVAKFKLFEHHSRIDIVFLCVFFLILALPSYKIDSFEKSTQENRMLATYKPFVSDNGGINQKYGKDFENWFNDHFFGRNLFINLYDKFKIIINNKIENEKLFEGQENWLFLKDDNGIQNFQNSELFSDIQLKRIASFLDNLDTWCKENNKKFYFVIAPDKNKIYGEYFKKSIKQVRPNSQSKTQQLLSYLKKHTDVHSIYLYDSLIAHKNKGFLYWKNDTHWNELGAYIGYLEIMKHIKQDFPDIEIVQSVSSTESQHLKGDLSLMFSDKLEDSTTYLIPDIVDNAKCTEINNKEFACNNPKGKLKLFIFRDSFAASLKRYISQSFVSSHFTLRNKIAPNDLLTMKKADIVIFEIVERATRSLSK